MKYAVDSCLDDTGLLKDKLDEIAAGGGRVVSVIWQPKRRVEIGDSDTFPPSGYVVVSEYT